MQDSFILTEYLNEFTKDADMQSIGIGCSGDKVIKITKPDGVYFLKYSDNPGIKSEYEKLYAKYSRKYSGVELSRKIKEKLYLKGLKYEAKEND